MIGTPDLNSLMDPSLHVADPEFASMVSVYLCRCTTTFFSTIFGLVANTGGAVSPRLLLCGSVAKNLAPPFIYTSFVSPLPVLSPFLAGPSFACR